MSIRICAWTDCESRFPTAEGPSVPGWKVFTSLARILLCPFHADLGHAPRVRRTGTRHSSPVQFSCICGEWAGLSAVSLDVGLRDWQQHIRMTMGRPAPDSAATISNGV